MSKNKLILGSAGNKGRSVKSDCFVQLELMQKGELKLKVNSKVSSLFGKTIEKLCLNILHFFEIKHAILTIDDTGALPFVMAARIEAAIKKLITTNKEYLLDGSKENRHESQKDRLRFSRLYLPGNTPKLMLNAGIHHPNGLILDLEDAVAPDKKFEASFLVRNALRNLNFYGAERMVRINQIPLGLKDLDFIVPHGVQLILIPKVESADQILKVNDRIKEIQLENNQDQNIWLMPIIESALGVIKAYEIASSAENIVALAIGLEDYTADLGTKRTNEATESFFARSMLVTAAKACGIQAIDSVFSDVSDMEALKQNVIKSKGLGFDGMGCIHPRQIQVIHDNFAPDQKDIEKATKIVRAFIEAKEKGLGVVSLGSKMIDAPVVKRAQTTVDLAVSIGLLEKNWME